MKWTTILLLFLQHVDWIQMQQDTIFAKGGTCLYKIRDQWEKCMEQQSARLTYDRDNLQPVYTRAALTESVNRISCCAYWKFRDCIEKAAEEHCPNEKRDMIAYTRQLGSAVPSDICLEEFPPHKCNRLLSWLRSSSFSSWKESVAFLPLVLSLTMAQIMIVI